MKKIMFFFLFVLTINAYSQCDYFYNLKEGAVFEMESYNHKDKKLGRVLNEVSEFSKTGDSFKATIHSVIFDKKDKEAHSGEYQMVCEDGVMKIDMRRFIPEETLESLKDAEIEMTGDYLTFPSNLSVGQALEDGSMTMTMTAGEGMVNMSTEILITDRKVESKEQITTPAGSFDCYKITYKLTSATKMMGMNMAKDFKNVDWISEGVGVVRTEAYNPKGALSSYSVLTRFEK